MSYNAVLKSDQLPEADAKLLSVVISAVETAMEERRGDDAAVWLDQLEEAVPDVGLVHFQLCEAGRLAHSARRYDIAERFAIRALLSFPKYGLAYMLLGDSLTSKGEMTEAARCFRYELPDTIRERYFGQSSCVMVDSSLSDEAGIERHLAYPSERYSLAQPIQTERVPVPDLDHDTLVSAEAYVGVVPDGRLWYDGGNAIVWDRMGRIVEDLGMGYAPLVHESVASRTPVRLSGRVCLLGNRSWLNYYHWMCDSMPRVGVLEAAGVDPASIDRFVIMPPRHPFHGDTLDMLGVGAARLHTTQQGEYIAADELIMPVFGSSSLGMAQGRWTSAFLKGRFGPATPSMTGKRLFVSRGTTGKRGIANEQALIDALALLDFQVVRCEELSVREQASLFASASVVLGPHGAGLTNTVFCEPGTLVVELFNAHMATCFWTISELTGLRHALHFCGYVDENTGLPGSDPKRSETSMDIRNNAFEVDIPELLTALDGLGVSDSSR